jgi:hypothetical protein
VRFGVALALVALVATLVFGKAEGQNRQEDVSTPELNIQLDADNVSAPNQANLDEDTAFSDFEAALNRLLDHPNCLKCVADYNAAVMHYQAAVFAAQDKVINDRCGARPGLCSPAPQKGR